MNLIQMKFKDNDMNKVEQLKTILGYNNRTKIVTEALSVYLEVMKNINEGKDLIFKDKNGNEEKIKFIF